MEEVDDFQQRVGEIILEISPPVDANEQQLHVLCKQLDSLKLDISARLKMLLEKTDPSSKGGGGAGYFGKRKWREKWPEKRKSIKNQRQPATEIEVLQSEIIILLAIEIA